MENFRGIIIEYNGWISVDKNDLKIVKIDNESGKFIKVDTTVLTNEEVVEILKSGEAVLKSFGSTYKKNAVDGEDDFTFSVEED